MLNFKGKIHDIDEFQDFGYVPELLDKTKELFERLGKPNGEEHIRRCGINVDYLKANSAGFSMIITNYPENGSRTSWIYYNKFDDESINIGVRAHEEAHAICHFGLRSEIEKRIDSPNLSDLNEEDFCKQAGIYAMRRKGIKPDTYSMFRFLKNVKI